MRREEPRTSTSDPRRKIEAPTPATAETRSVPEVPATASAAPAPRTEAVGAPAPEAPRKVKTSGRAEKLLEAELRPSVEQMERIRAVFEERARSVEAYETEVHQRGWSHLDDFGFRVAELRGLSYRRIAALLDSEQAARFEALRPALFDKDPISISLPDDKVVILDLKD